MSGGGLAPFYDGWRKCDARLVGALRTLSPEHLGLGASPSHMPLWAIAAHAAHHPRRVPRRRNITAPRCARPAGDRPLEADARLAGPLSPARSAPELA